MTTATREGIVWCWLERLATDTVNFDSAMNVTDETYINYAPVAIDHDYYQGHLLEVVERDSGVISYVAVAAFHGSKTIVDDDETILIEWDHDSMWYEPLCGTFFERTDAADPVTVGQWAVQVIYGMFESYAERRRIRS